MDVAILGCGPAGLMAALAVRDTGNTPVIFSRKQKSPLYGAQYLHKPIPGVTDRDDFVTVDYILKGDVEAYRRKVYGPMWDGRVSPDELEAQHQAWDIRETYDRLWSMFSGHINDCLVDPAGVYQLTKSYRLIINTIPLNMICHEGHMFRATEVVAAGDAPTLGIDVGTLYHCPPDTVVCNGDESPSWYRLSRIFGHTTVEWPQGIKPPVGTASKVTKPTKNNCDCWDDTKVLKLGRYGSWQKGVLSHTAYDKTIERIDGGKTAQEARYNNPDMPTLF